MLNNCEFLFLFTQLRMCNVIGFFLIDNFFILFSGSSVASSRRFLTDFLQEYPTPGTGPYFDTSVQANITGLVGKTVHLICKVKNLGNRTVSVICCKHFLKFYENQSKLFLYT